MGAKIILLVLFKIDPKIKKRFNLECFLDKKNDDFVYEI